MLLHWGIYDMDEVERLPSDELFRFLKLSYGILQRPFEELFKGELTALQLHVLYELKVGGKASVTALSERLRIPKQQMSKLLSKLAGAGYIRRVPVPDDRRSVMLEISERTSAILDDRCSKYIEKFRNVLVREGIESESFMSAVRLLSDTLECIHEDKYTSDDI